MTQARTQGRTVVLGGATARTGEAVLRAFLDAGYRVLATTRRPDVLRQTLARLAPRGGGGGAGEVEVVTADLLDPGAAERVVAVARERFGRVDAATTLASGGFQQRPFAETSLDDLRGLIEGNLYMTYNLCRAAAPVMLEQGGGHLLTIAGGSALDPAYGRALFGASKAAVVTLTKGIARDHKGQGIVANCLVAGTIATADARRHLSPEDLAAAVTLEEFASAVVFLCSARSSGINGTAVELNAREID
jgi:meso-butanediol dehydrogenase / (S,S)-butanediol dehydrogenase / diacetyl reductase